MCLSRKDKLLSLLTPAGYGAYCLYMTNDRLKSVDFVKNARVEVMTINTFHGDLRPSLWQWRAYGSLLCVCRYCI